MMKKLSIIMRDTSAGSIEEVRAELYIMDTVQLDDMVTYDGLLWRVENVQFKHMILTNTGYYDCTLIRPNQLYPSPTVVVPIMEVFYPVMDPDVSVGSYPLITLANNATETVYHQVKIPDDFVSLISLNVIIIPGASGNMYRQATVKWGAVCVGETPDLNSGTLPAGKTTMINGVFTCISLALPVAGSSVDDLIGVSFSRLGGHALDTVDASCFYAGILLRFNV